MIGKGRNVKKLIDAETLLDEYCIEFCGYKSDDEDLMCQTCTVKKFIDNAPDCSQCDTD